MRNYYQLRSKVLLLTILLLISMIFRGIIRHNKPYNHLYTPYSSYSEEDYYEYSTYLGGADIDVGYGISARDDGTVYFVGYTKSTDFYLKNEFQSQLLGDADLFITRMNQNGTCNFSTYFGGNDNDRGMDIVVDKEGSMYILGYTESTDFPKVNAIDTTIGEYEAFLIKFNESNQIVFSTLLGGSEREYPNGLAVDTDGACYVVGKTYSADFPTQNAIQSNLNGSCDMFITKFNPDGSLNFSTYYGGSYIEEANDIAVDENGICYIVGETRSDDFPLLNSERNFSGSIDVAAIALNTEGTLNYSIVFGGSDYDWATGVAITLDGDCILTGNTRSPDYPILGENSAIFNDATDCIIAQINPDGSLNRSTCFGGSAQDEAESIAVDGEGDYYITGHTLSTDFPLLNHTQMYSPYIMMGAIISQFDKNGELKWSTCYGGDNSVNGNSINYGFDIEVDQDGYVYTTGWTNTPTFHLFNHISSFNGERDAYAIKIRDIVPVPEPEPEPKIPGIDILFLIGLTSIFCVRLVIIVKKQASH